MTLVVTAIALSTASSASAAVPAPGTNDFGGFRNVLGVGQGQTANASDLARNQADGSLPETFQNQRSLYTSLAGAAPNVTAANIGSFFKPAGFGTTSPTASETPKPGVTIIRDSFHVPHVYGETRADTLWGAGYSSAEDRLFLMDVLRHTGRARLSELAGTGTNNSNLKSDIDQLKVADYSEEELQRQIDEPVKTFGAAGQRLKQDVTDYSAGINAYIDAARSDASKLPAEYPALGKMPTPWKPTDTVAVASLIGGIFGLGGGAEVQNAEILQAARARFGRRAGDRVFRDFREREDPEAPVSTLRRFPFDEPGKVNPRAVALPDRGSVTSLNSGATGGASAASTNGPAWLNNLQRHGLGLPKQESNAMLVTAKHSKSGHALAVMGPQVSYYSPEILNEEDLHGPGFDARGAAFPGISLYVLLGRGRDFAWSATTATSDNVDIFFERLCNTDGTKATRDSDHYLYKGKCIALLKRDHVLSVTPGPASFTSIPPKLPLPTPKTITLKIERSVHGPIQGTATVNGAAVAISKARSTYFHEVDSALSFEQLNTNAVHDAASFRRVMGKINFLFNWFYADDKDITFQTSGWYPRRARGTDPSLPVWGTGQYDWQGFRASDYSEKRIAPTHIPHDQNPARGYIVNWNNKQAPGWHAADDVFAYGSVHRSERLEKRVKAAIRGSRKIDLPQLVGIMGDAGTVDLRGQETYPWMRAIIGNTRDARTAPLLALLDSWVRRGAHRVDRNGDNVLEDSPAVALMDAWWNPMIRRVFQPRLGSRLTDAIKAQLSFDQPAGRGGSAYFSGWWGYVDKDLRSILRRPVRGRFSLRYCGNGSRRSCRAILVRTLLDAERAAVKAYGVAKLSDIKRPATCDKSKTKTGCDQIEFTTAGALDTPPIPWQDRGTFQQAVEVRGHRPR